MQQRLRVQLLQASVLLRAAAALVGLEDVQMLLPRWRPAEKEIRKSDKSRQRVRPAKRLAKLSWGTYKRQQKHMTKADVMSEKKGGCSLRQTAPWSSQALMASGFTWF